MLYSDVYIYIIPHVFGQAQMVGSWVVALLHWAIALPDAPTSVALRTESSKERSQPY